MPIYTILLTACINPAGMTKTFLQNVEIREQQYIEAINYYLNYTNYKIVFCNNSGEDISAKIECKKERIEFINYHGNNYDVQLGKGYGEFEIMRYAFENSQFLKESKYIIKITGRLIIENLIRTIKMNDLIWLFCPNKLYVSIYEDIKFADSRCFVVSNRFLRQFLSYDNIINDTKNYYFEHFLFDVISKNKDHYLIVDFSYPLQFSGQSGSSGEIYIPMQKSFQKDIRILRNYFIKVQSLQNLSILRSVCVRVISFFLRAINFICARVK